MFFGLIHVGDFDNIGDVWYIALFLVLPQINTGFFLGYFRVAKGLGWSILAHMLNNLSSIMLILPLKFISPEITKAVLSRQFELFQNLPIVDLAYMTFVFLVFGLFLTIVFYYEVVYKI